MLYSGHYFYHTPRNQSLFVVARNIMHIISLFRFVLICLLASWRPRFFRIKPTQKDVYGLGFFPFFLPFK